MANPNLVKENAELKASLVHDLQLINTLSGEFHFAPKALELYVDWYEEEEALIREHRHKLRDPMFSGYNARRATHVKKLGMVMSASRGSDMVITERDFKRALALMEAAERKMPQVFAGVGTTRYATETQLVLEYLARSGTATKSDILRTFNRAIDTGVLDVIIKVLEGMKVIRVEIGRSDVTYRYVGDPI